MFVLTPETTSVREFWGGMETGLTKVSVFVTVMLRVTDVLFRNDQNLPASAVAVEAGRVTALNPLFVK